MHVCVAQHSGTKEIRIMYILCTKMDYYLKILFVSIQETVRSTAYQDTFIKLYCMLHKFIYLCFCFIPNFRKKSLFKHRLVLVNGSTKWDTLADKFERLTKSYCLIILRGYARSLSALGTHWNVQMHVSTLSNANFFTVAANTRTSYYGFSKSAPFFVKFEYNK